MTKLAFLLSERGLTVADLAKKAGTSPGRVYDVINNRPTQGRFTARRIAVHLTEAERAEVGLDADGNRVPRETVQPEVFADGHEKETNHE
jgi:transcriptional regulator with XRE-family HTH domain